MSTATDESPEHRVGKLLAGKWRVERLLGVGSVASAYAAIDEATGARVALKVIHPELLEDAAVRARFLREARLAGSVEHPGIVRVHDDGVAEDGAPFLAMEFLDGETIDARMRRKGGKLPVREALWVADAVLDTLGAAHAMGLVHRDIRVENVFLTSDHAIKVLDFAVARVRRAAERRATSATAMASRADATATSDDADRVEDDLWAVGAAMFTMITGEPVLEGQLREDLVHSTETVEMPLLAATAPHAPADVASLVDRSLSLKAGRAWTDAASMQRSVRDVIEIVKTRASHNPHVASPFSAPMRATPRRAISAEAPSQGGLPIDVKIPRATAVPGDVRLPGMEGSTSSLAGTVSLRLAATVIAAAVVVGGALAWFLGR